VEVVMYWPPQSQVQRIARASQDSDHISGDATHSDEVNNSALMDAIDALLEEVEDARETG
jgi:hypothetical protein